MHAQHVMSYHLIKVFIFQFLSQREIKYISRYFGQDLMDIQTYTFLDLVPHLYIWICLYRQIHTDRYILLNKHFLRRKLLSIPNFKNNNF